MRLTCDLNRCHLCFLVRFQYCRNIFVFRCVSILYLKSVVMLNEFISCVLLCDLNRCHSCVLVRFQLILCGRLSAFSIFIFQDINLQLAATHRQDGSSASPMNRCWCRLDPTSMIIARRLYGPTTVKVGQLVVGIGLSPRKKVRRVLYLHQAIF